MMRKARQAQSPIYSNASVPADKLATPAAACEDTVKAGTPDKASSKSMVKSVFLALLAGLVINIFIGLLVDFGKLVTAFRQTSTFTVIAPFTLVLIIYVIDALRFQLVFSKFKIRLSFRDSLYNNVIGYFFSNITPGSVGGQPFQVVHFSKLGLNSTISSNVVFSRLMEGNIVQLLIVAAFFHKGIGMISAIGKGAYLLTAGMLVTIVLTFLLVLSFLNPHLLGVLALKIEKSWAGRLIARITKNPCWAEKISAWSNDLGAGFKVLWSHNTWTMVFDIFIFLIDQILWALALYIPLTVITGGSVPLQEFFLSFTLCWIVSLFIPTPGAAGSVEASYLLVMSALTGDTAATMSAILLWRFGTYYLHLFLGGLVYFFVSTPKNVYAADEAGVLRRIRIKHAL
jgi:glycosyltransferase 2 family protein